MRRLVHIVIGLFIASSALAQSYALPSKTPDAQVPCAAGCSIVTPPPMTVGYKLPIKTFTGRFLDSSGVSAWFKPFRTARANFVLVKPELDRIYFRYGEGTVVAYKLSTFFTRLEAGESLVFPQSIPPYATQQRGGHTELFLRWDAYFNPELGGGWITGNADGGTRLTGFDVDDQQYVYVASTMYGWGIVQDGPFGMSSVMQRYPGGAGDATPGKIAALKGATRYYAYLSGNQPLWDVTDRAHPVLLPVTAPLMAAFAKNAAADRVAIVNAQTTSLAIYSADTLAAGGAPLFTDPSGGYQWVTGDGSDFFALGYDAGARVIVVVVPTATGYAIQGKYPIGNPPMDVTSIHYGSGYVVLTGTSGSWDLRLFKVGSNLIPTRVITDSSPADPFASYFRSYYGAAPVGYVTPGYINPLDGTVYKAGAKTYLIFCAGGVGDVYELAGATPIPFTDTFDASWVTPIRAVHITELRSKIDALRVSHGLPAFTYGSAVVAGVHMIKASSITELRTALSQVYVAAGMAPPTFTDPILSSGVTAKSTHIAELRAAVLAIEAN